MSTLLALAIVLALASPASATVLVSDPAHPVPTKRLALLQQAVDQSALPTPAGFVVLSTNVTESVGCGLAGDHYIQLDCLDRFSLMHELAHESQMFSGPGGTIITKSGNYGWAGGWSDKKIGALMDLTGIKRWGRLAEVSADAYAQCALHPRWYRWWGHYKRRTKKVSVWVSTPTPYGFQAGPKKYAAICAALAQT